MTVEYKPKDIWKQIKDKQRITLTSRSLTDNKTYYLYDGLKEFTEGKIEELGPGHGGRMQLEVYEMSFYLEDGTPKSKDITNTNIVDIPFGETVEIAEVSFRGS